jgi:hypothetical protein
MTRAQALGVDVSKLPYLGETEGVGGKSKMWRCRGRIFWTGGAICTDFVVAEKLPVILLGRQDFFLHYSVDFSRWQENPPIMVVERNP